MPSRTTATTRSTARTGSTGRAAPQGAAARVTEKARAGKARLDATAARAVPSRADIESLGEFLKEQRRGAQLTLRQLADQAGVSNPYLSQIERGLRKPSADVLQQLAKALRVSAETLYVRAGILDPDESGERTVQLVVLADPGLTERQKQVMLDIYTSFRRENENGG
jgi:transcriptional regulator with XRE-family HTH domain